MDKIMEYRVKRLEECVRKYQMLGCYNKCSDPVFIAREFMGQVTVECQTCGRKVRSDGSIIVHGHEAQPEALVRDSAPLNPPKAFGGLLWLKNLLA